MQATDAIEKENSYMYKHTNSDADQLVLCDPDIANRY